MPENTSQAQQFDRPAGNSKSSGGAMRWVIVIVIIAAIILGGLYLVSKNSKYNVLGVSQTAGEWQAVFLTNGQVYFGKILSDSNQELRLTEIYYLQITQPLQRSASEQGQQQNQQNELALVKLGNELHGPQDLMRINREHVLFIENLKTDSKVVQAIEQSKQEKAQE